MDVYSSYLHQTKPIPSPILRPPPLSVLSRISFSLRPRRRTTSYSFRPSRKTDTCSASSGSDTLVASNRKEDSSKSVASNKEEAAAEDDEFDLKSWMHKNGLPPCKVVLKEKPSYDKNHRPIHYVAASADLQVYILLISLSCFHFLFLPFKLFGDIIFSCC